MLCYQLTTYGRKLMQKPVAMKLTELAKPSSTSFAYLSCTTLQFVSSPPIKCNLAIPLCCGKQCVCEWHTALAMRYNYANMEWIDTFDVLLRSSLLHERNCMKLFILTHMCVLMCVSICICLNSTYAVDSSCFNWQSVGEF